MDPQDRLFGEIAVRLMLLSREQVATCMHAQEAQATPKRIGEVAMDLGYMALHDVELVLAQQRRVLERRRGAQPPGKPPSAAGMVEQQAVVPDQRSAGGQAASEARGAARADKPGEERQHSIADAATAPVPALRVPEPRAKRWEPDTRAPQARAASPAGAAAAGADDYDFAAPSGTQQSAGAAATAKAASTATLLQSFGGPQKRVPADRAWRNPSRPPAPQNAQVSGPAPGHAGAPLRAAGTLAWAPAPEPMDARGPVAEPAPAAARALAQRPAPSTEEAGYLDRVLKLSQEAGASDLHAHSDAPLLARVDGALWPLSGDAPLPAAAAQRVIAEIMSDAQWEIMQREGQVRFTHEVAGVGRFRATAYRQERGIDITFRVLARRVPSLEELGLPLRIGKLCNSGNGLYLFTGPLGAGKSASLASVIDLVADELCWHVISLEQPIEFLHAGRRALIVQREVPTHVPSLAQGVELALREDPDAIVISDLEDAASIAAAVRAARSGCRVFACMRAGSVLQAVTRLIDAFPEHARAVARADLAECLRLIVGQRLLTRPTGRGRVPALEVLVATAQISHLVREDKLQQIVSVLAAGKGGGMQALDDSLEELLRAGTINEAQALRFAQKKERFKTG